MTRRNVSSQAAKATGIYMIQRKQLFFFIVLGVRELHLPTVNRVYYRKGGAYLALV